MSRSSKRDKSELELHRREDQFSSDLIAALQECAAGRWGVFGQNDSLIEQQPKALQQKLGSPVAAALIEDGEAIRRLRDELGYTDPFPPFERYLKYREIWSANSLGEPKLAAEFLLELSEKARTDD